MKQLFLIISMCVTFISVSAQQTPIYTMYMLNDFAINPAIAGTDDFMKAQVNRRYQYVGIDGAPLTTSFSVHGNLDVLSMGWGGHVYKDTYGPFSKFGAYGAYAYRIALDRSTDLSFGVNVGLINYSINTSSFVTINNEPHLDPDQYSFIKPDATLGVYIKSRDYYAGITADQLFNNKLSVLEVDDTIRVDGALNRLTTHVSLMGGYHYRLSYGFVMEPNLVLRKSPRTPLQVEATARLVYDKTAWAGIGYRSGDAVTLLLGYAFEKKYYFAYAYDITYSQLRKDSYGTHEIMIGVRFPEPFF
ncbi:MAG: type IX secretion system membrane protein PorP/SprF [Bacteroidales bacterium]